MIGEDLPLVFYYRFLIAQNSGLIADHQLEATLIAQHLLLIRDDPQLMTVAGAIAFPFALLDFNLNCDCPVLA